MIELSAWSTIPGITLEPGPELSPHPHTRAQARKQNTKAIRPRKAASKPVQIYITYKGASL